MDEELGRERCQRAADPENVTPNYRNGYSRKTVKTQLGEIDINVPRDRKGNYEPKIISKYDRNAEGMEDKILSLYACGMSQRDIAEQIKCTMWRSPLNWSARSARRSCRRSMPGRTDLWKASILLSSWMPSTTK